MDFGIFRTLFRVLRELYLRNVCVTLRNVAQNGYFQNNLPTFSDSVFETVLSVYVDIRVRRKSLDVIQNSLWTYSFSMGVFCYRHFRFLRSF